MSAVDYAPTRRRSARSSRRTLALPRRHIGRTVALSLKPRDESMKSIRLLPAATVVSSAAILLAVSTAAADVVTGTVTPAGATVVVVDSSGAVVAKLSSGPYQLQLPVGKFKARCTAPKEREQEFLSLSDPVTVNINCG